MMKKLSLLLAVSLLLLHDVYNMDVTDSVEGHRAGMLDDFTYLGVGGGYVEGKLYDYSYIQNFYISK